MKPDVEKGTVEPVLVPVGCTVSLLVRPKRAGALHTLQLFPKHALASFVVRSIENDGPNILTQTVPAQLFGEDFDGDRPPFFAAERVRPNSTLSVTLHNIADSASSVGMRIYVVGSGRPARRAEDRGL